MNLFLNILTNPGVILALLVAVVGFIAITAFLIKKYVINPKQKKEKTEEKELTKEEIVFIGKGITKEEIASEELNRVLEEIEDESVANKVKEYNEKED